MIIKLHIPDDLDELNVVPLCTYMLTHLKSHQDGKGKPTAVITVDGKPVTVKATKRRNHHLNSDRYSVAVIGTNQEEH